MIIQRATGHPAHQEIEDRVLRPLGLDQTRWTGTSPALPRPHAEAYQLFGPGSLVGVTEQIAVDHETSFATTTRDENRLLRALLAGRLLPPRQLAEMKQTVPVSAEVQQMWPGGRFGLGLVERPLTCGGTYWSHEGGDGGYITLNGVTDDGRRSAVVAMSGGTRRHLGAHPGPGERCQHPDRQRAVCRGPRHLVSDGVRAGHGAPSREIVGSRSPARRPARYEPSASRRGPGW